MLTRKPLPASSGHSQLMYGVSVWYHVKGLQFVWPSVFWVVNHTAYTWRMQTSAHQNWNIQSDTGIKNWLRFLFWQKTKRWLRLLSWVAAYETGPKSERTTWRLEPLASWSKLKQNFCAGGAASACSGMDFGQCGNDRPGFGLLAVTQKLRAYNFIRV